MTHLYLECVSGIAGNMALAALIDAGACIDAVRSTIEAVLPDRVVLDIKEVQVQSLRAQLLTVALVRDEPEPARHWSEIRDMISSASIVEEIRSTAMSVFSVLAEAEARVHGVAVDDVHFHEVGAWDSIADIVGVAAALENLEVTSVSASPVPVGTGFIQTAHGRLPIPVPATAELLMGIPTVATGISGELTTPTGAAIIRALAQDFRSGPDMVAKSVGYGAGHRHVEDRPNVVRAWIGERDGAGGQSLWQLETNLDDSSGELLGHAFQQVMAAGAVDAWITPIQMKKNRPGVIFSLLCKEQDLKGMRKLLFTETSALGIREQMVSRTVLEREESTIEVAGHSVRIKGAVYEGETVNLAPEYEDLRQLSVSTGIPLKQLYSMCAGKTAQRKL